MRKVYLLQEIIPNYRVPVFARIANLEGIDLTVFYSAPSKAMAAENLKNSPEFSEFQCKKIPLNDFRKFSWQLRFFKYILFNRPDVVISGQAGQFDRLLFLVICKILGIRFLWYQGGNPYTKQKEIQAYTTRGWLNKFLGANNPRRWLVNQADGMIVYSENAKRYYSSLGFKKPIFTAPNSPDTDKLLAYKSSLINNPETLEQLKKQYAAKGEKVVFMLGRLNRARKTDVLINAFEIVQKKYPLTALIIVGDGCERPMLENMAAQKNLQKVHFLGAIYDDEILSRYFMLCDVYVTPGVASLTLKMAMTFGKPVVSCAYGLEVHSIENGENGFVVDIDDSKGLAQKILLLLKDDKLRIEMGKNAKETIANKINIHEMIEGFKRAIHFAVDGRL